MESAASHTSPGDTWSVYILRNPAGRCFVGHTHNLTATLATADIDVSKWTGQKGPWPLVWRHDGLTQAAALKYEVSLKRDKNSPRFYARTGLKPLDEIVIQESPAPAPSSTPVE
jgi:predicted GIY-YIG superfamily endonuclease